jgi:membrane carboxypeptidase/penicillin-binding protein PbpC
MNVIEWGSGIWGCRQAALHYFGKTPETLDLFGSSFLAAVIPAPLRPIGDWYPQSGRKLQIRVLFQLFLAGLITIEMLADALARTQMMPELISQEGAPNLAAAIFPELENIQAFKNFLGLADKELQCAANRPVLRDEMLQRGSAWKRNFALTGKPKPGSQRTPSGHFWRPLRPATVLN